MDFNLLESYVTKLIEMIMTGDINGFDAIKKYQLFSIDIQKHYKILEKGSKKQ